MNDRFVSAPTILSLLFATVLFASTAASQDLRLVTSAAENDSLAVSALLAEDGVDVNATRADGATALLWAAHWDNVEMAKQLLKTGANVNAPDDHGVTALERAAENTSVTMTTLLLAAGADPNASQASGMTPLMTAARTGNVHVLDALISHGANVNAETSETRSTAMMWAVAAPHPDAVRLLLDAGANAQASTAKGFTVLMYAANNGDIEMAKLLLTAGVDVNQVGLDGTHTLPYAIARGQDKFALFLLEHGADPNGAMEGIRALHAAAGNTRMWLDDWSRRHGHGGSYLRGGFRTNNLTPSRRLPLIRALINAGADPNARIATSAMFMNYIGYPTKGAFEPFACGTGDLHGATPLWVAAYTANGGTYRASPGNPEGYAEILQTLLDAGANLHLTTADGTTPFMAAAGLGQPTFRPRQPRGIRSRSAEIAVRVLVEAGANINAVNEADFTALHGAAFRGLNEVIEYLVAEGADIDARDFRARTAFRMAEGSKQSFQFQAWPETAALLTRLGANTRLGVPGTVQERLRDVPVSTAQTNQDQ